MEPSGARRALPVEVMRELAKKYGTPLYVYQIDSVRRAVDRLREAIPPAVRIYYSVKANPHPALIGAVTEHGLLLEISSAGELAAASSAGVPGDRCLYTGPAKTTREMVDALRFGVSLFSIESPADHSRLVDATESSSGGIHAAAEHLVRLNGRAGNTAAGLRMTGTPSQFGVAVGALRRMPGLLAQTDRTRPVGFHLFSATNLVDEADLLSELTANAQTAAEVAEQAKFTPEVVDIGGGFAAPFAVPAGVRRYPALRNHLARVLNTWLPGWQSGRPAVAVESGRHLVAESGTLLTTVMDVKDSGGRSYVVCDAGVNTLGGMSGIGRLLPPSAQPDGHAGDTSPPVTLTGPLCTPLDVLNRAAKVRDPRIGDMLAVPNVGAYGLTASLVAFLGRPMPVEVVLDGDSVIAARRLRLTDVPLDQEQQAPDPSAAV